MRRKVLIVGDSMADVYTFLERSGSDCTLLYTSIIPGGAANVANMFSTIEANISEVSLLLYGQDTPELRAVADTLIASNIKVIWVDSDSNMTVKYRHIIKTPKEEINILYYSDDNKIPVTTYMSNILNELSSYTKDDILVIQDYDKLAINSYDLHFILEYCDYKGIVVFMDPKNILPNDEPIFCVKMNRKEFDKFYNDGVSDEMVCPVESRISIFGKSYSNIEVIIVTDGANGYYIYNKGVVLSYSVPTSDKHIHTCGAGDTFLAALVSGYTLNEDIQKAAQFAGATASYNCIQKYTSIVPAHVSKGFIKQYYSKH